MEVLIITIVCKDMMLFAQYKRPQQFLIQSTLSLSLENSAKRKRLIPDHLHKPSVIKSIGLVRDKQQPSINTSPPTVAMQESYNSFVSSNNFSIFCTFTSGISPCGDETEFPTLNADRIKVSPMSAKSKPTMTG